VLNWKNARPADIVNGHFVSPDVFPLLCRGADRRADTGEGPTPEHQLQGYVWPPDFGQSLAPLGADFEFIQVARMLMEEPDKPNLLAIYEGKLDAVEHKYWQYFQPEKYLWVSPEKIEEFGNIIPEVHTEIDEWVGQLRAMLPDDGIMIVLSDHGHCPAFLENLTAKGGHNNSPDGVLIIAGNGISAGATINQPNVYDITPTVLFMMGLPVAQDMSGRILEEVFEKEVLKARDSRWIASYGTWNPSAPLDITIDEGVEEDALEELKALGYIR
jgi:hypothetical protein